MFSNESWRVSLINQAELFASFKTKHRYRKFTYNVLITFGVVLASAFLNLRADVGPNNALGTLPPSNRVQLLNSIEKCGTSVRINCVIDGDTFYLDGTSIRVADIDTPETRRAKCTYEANLGAKATIRFMALLNAGPFEVRPIPNRDEDRYGRKLRTIYRNGQSLGGVLVAEGLARIWDGHRHPWC